ncbi:MAG: adenylate kinase family protein [Holosporaceae bacterium]
MRIVLLGLPGSGKGTQARLLSRALKVPFLGAGDLLRLEVKEKTPLGKLLKPILDAGDFPDEKLVVDICLKHILAMDGFVLEGFPRTKTQYLLFDEALKKVNKKMDAFFYLDLPEEEAVRRLAGRVTCLSCGATYGAKDIGKKTCDFCGKDTMGVRADDKDDVVRKRLRLQKERNDILLSCMQSSGVVHTIDATQTPDQVTQSVLGVLAKPSP